MADINVTPLVDVMLVLLIIFIITAPLMSHKVQVELPEANLVQSPEDAEKRSGPITVAVKEDGSLYWNDEPVPRKPWNRALPLRPSRPRSRRSTCAATAPPRCA
jgi:Biopolymer transport protein